MLPEASEKSKTIISFSECNSVQSMQLFLRESERVLLDETGIWVAAHRKMLPSQRGWRPERNKKAEAAGTRPFLLDSGSATAALCPQAFELRMAGGGINQEFGINTYTTLYAK